MPPLIHFVLWRLFYALVSLFILALVLFVGVMVTPAEARAQLYLPPERGGERDAWLGSAGICWVTD